MHTTKPRLTAPLKRAGLGLLLCAVIVASQAATSTGQFSININLTGAGTGSTTSSGVCISETLSKQTNAVVRVVCGRQQFVSITTNPNTRFLGTHGGAFRFTLIPSSTSTGSQFGGQGQYSDFYPGIGTVTALHIDNVNGSEGPLEVLLTF